MAVSVIGPFIVTEAGLLVPVNDPGPLPVQLEKVKPRLGVALIVPLLPALNHPVAG